MRRVILESAPEFVVVCVLIGLAYAFIQYYRTRQQPWGKAINWLLFSIRAILTFFLAFLLLGPIVKQINNLFEKPHFIVLYDNSASVKEATDSVLLKQTQQQLSTAAQALEEKGYDVATHTLLEEDANNIQYTASQSDIQGALRRISNRYEGQNIAGVILASDGIYNSGLSPLYASFNYPVYTIGLGDTTERTDVSIKNVSYNKIAYQGNKFPLRAEVQAKNLKAQDLVVSVFKRGKLVDRQTKRTTGEGLISFDFQVLAEEQGIQKLDVQVEPKDGEQNVRNNRSSVFVEVVEGKKKILLVAPSPHPDIKALREVIEKNSNYEFLLHIPGVSEQQPNRLRADDIDLAIFHQSPDLRGRTNTLFQSFVKGKSSLLLVLGLQSDLRYLAAQGMPVKFDNTPRDYDEVTPVINPAFSNFSLSEEANTIIANFPPVSVHFGKHNLPLTSTPLLYQRIGNVNTQKPLLTVDIKESRKISVTFGEGLWRWRLNEFDRTENTTSFDELFGKLIQFLSTTDDKRKFRSYPLQQEFSDTEAVVFESQVYNDIFEPVYGNNIKIFITDESGKRNEYSYVTSPGNIRYQIGGLKEGVYRYRSQTVINGKTEEVRGEFAVVEQQAELQNLTADFDLLKRLSFQTGGRFYEASKIGELQQELQKTEARSIIHTEETFDSIINLKWVFWLLITLVSAEWFLRRYHGSY
ncbi:VWA domain-containing protein [Chryseosolibacter indicus]|uniref:VWA domain-containing protein n=1 Tax=Chryseosolibacter indicus TaxID=2782351 RepID=A0ABS5VTJ4_9BACT|nr:VWA domain-containing protein [Chryseosolibacter indicus]MBT1704378.1 VWA domain-containing protein [Chryseosolibacter indicus]